MAVNEPDEIPLPEWIEREAARRLEEMRDPQFRLSHEEIWKRITDRKRSTDEDNTELNR